VTPIHLQVLEAAHQIADRRGRFGIAELVRAVPHLNAATVRTHVASRCCVNAPSNHASRHPYFRALSRGQYQIVRHAPRARSAAAGGWQDRILASRPPGVDITQIVESLKRSPTERLEAMQQALRSLDGLRGW
jgi:hypothetical protein